MADQIRTRRRELLAEIRQYPGVWTTGMVNGLYQATGWGPCRTTARKDLQALARRGVLIERGPVNARTYTLKGGA